MHNNGVDCGFLYPLSSSSSLLKNRGNFSYIVHFCHVPGCVSALNYVFFTSNVLALLSKAQEFVLSDVAPSQSQRECAVSMWDVQDTACGTGFIS